VSDTDPARRADITLVWLAAGALLMGLSVGCSIVTVAGSGPGLYRPVLTLDIGATVAALACLLVVFVRGGNGLPADRGSASIYVIHECIRRF
jgi:hypothetical protein